MASSVVKGNVPPDLSTRTVAYFSMEIALSPDLPTYSGGLGMLAGDTLRSAADTSAPMVAVSLVHRRGYFRQHLDMVGQQTESEVPWSPEDTLSAANRVVTIMICGREVMVRAWCFEVVGISGHIIPVYLLDSDLESNSEWDRRLTDHLYGGDAYYRLCQEAILGIAGVEILRALGCQPSVFHMNEGHAALLSVRLLEEQLKGDPLYEAREAHVESVRQQCVFTTHTPVPAGHDQFSFEHMYQVLGHERASAIERLGCIHEGQMNMTYLALNFSRSVNGVAMQHGKVSQQMFPDYKVGFVTNGIHAGTWLSRSFQELFDVEIPNWRLDNQFFRSIYGIDPALISHAHLKGKLSLFRTVAARTGQKLNPTVLTLGFARRVATYKRASLLFTDPARLEALAENMGGLQILFAGKAHPADAWGKALIRDVFTAAQRLNSRALKIVYLENYDWDLGAELTQGVDVWINTPKRPYEASGTSGMKAAINGIPSLSILDGWWIEGCAENVTGWAIEDAETEASEAANLYQKLENRIAPMFATPAIWSAMQRHCIAMNGSFFNTHRMLGQYIANVYLQGMKPGVNNSQDSPTTAGNSSRAHQREEGVLV